MKRSYHLWILALFITVGSAVFQRMTGPSYPKQYVTLLDGKAIEVVLKRSHGENSDHIVVIPTNKARVTGYIEWKRYKTSDKPQRRDLTLNSGILSAHLPLQPPAGKLHYTVVLTDGKETFSGSAVIRFRGEVPTAVLIIHIIAMFTAMLLSARTGLEVFAQTPSYRWLTYATVAAITFGGMMMGPLVQKYAFDAWWTGYPFGTDLTDNKTFVSFAAWIGALVAVQRSSAPRRWIIAAALVTLLIFLIPHSMWGSELDYSTMPSP